MHPINSTTIGVVNKNNLGSSGLSLSAYPSVQCTETVRPEYSSLWFVSENADVGIM